MIMSHELDQFTYCNMTLMHIPVYLLCHDQQVLNVVAKILLV